MNVDLSPQRSPVFRATAPRCSPDVVYIPRLLSADVSCYPRQETGDIVIELSSEEDFDD